LNNLYVIDLAIDPATPDVLWAGTRGGLFRSQDGGATWEVRSREITNPANGELLPVVVELSPPQGVWIGTDRGLFRSSDEGESWVHVLQDYIVLALVADPQDADSLLVSSTFPGALNGGLAQTSDGGVTWTSLYVAAPGRGILKHVRQD